MPPTPDPTVAILKEWVILVPVISTAIVTILNVILAFLNRTAVQKVKTNLERQDVVLADQTDQIAAGVAKVDDLHGAVSQTKDQIQRATDAAAAHKISDLEQQLAAALARNVEPQAPVQVNVAAPPAS